MVCFPRDEEDQDNCCDEAEEEFWGRGGVSSEGGKCQIHLLILES